MGIDIDKKLALQHKVQEGLDADDLRVARFGDRFLASAQKKALDRLLQAKTFEELVSVREEYRAVVRFLQDLTSVGREGRQAAKRLKEMVTHEQQHENEV